VHDGSCIIGPDDPILVTGAAGFIGPALIESLLCHGFRRVRAFVKPSNDLTRLEEIARNSSDIAKLTILKGNLLSSTDCAAATAEVAVIFHLASCSDKSFANAYMNAVVSTRNLLEASLQHRQLRRFVNVSSFAVYANQHNNHGCLDESTPMEEHSERYGEAYCFAKVKQDELVIDYGKKQSVPYVIVRPGSVYGPGKTAITGRVGIDTFGMFLHLGGSSRIPLTYVDNCADAIVLAGVKPHVDNMVFNVVDDDLPTSRQFLRAYKRNVKRFRSLYVPHCISYALCAAWEKYSSWSQGQLPPVFNRRRWYTEWKKTAYSNQMLKTELGWKPKVSTRDGLLRYFSYCREAQRA